MHINIDVNTNIRSIQAIDETVVFVVNSTKNSRILSILLAE